MEERETVDHDIVLVIAVDLGETERGMDLVAVGQTDQLRSAGRAAGVEQCTDRIAVAHRFKVERFGLGTLHCRGQAGTAVQSPGLVADHDHVAQTGNATEHCLRLGPAHRVKCFRRDHEDGRPFGFEQVGDGLGTEEIV